jgi:hypothetical protein
MKVFALSWFSPRIDFISAEMQTYTQLPKVATYMAFVNKIYSGDLLALLDDALIVVHHAAVEISENSPDETEFSKGPRLDVIKEVIELVIVLGNAIRHKLCFKLRR